jgi:hypothetical protein
VEQQMASVFLEPQQEMVVLDADNFPKAIQQYNDGYKCESCHGATTAREFLMYTPSVVLLTLRRQRSYDSKEADPAFFPYEVAIPDKVDTAYGTYRLVWAAEHKGKKVNYGHFTTKIRRSLDKDGWWNVDCATKTEVDGHFRNGHRNVSSVAYVSSSVQTDLLSVMNQEGMIPRHVCNMIEGFLRARRQDRAYVIEHERLVWNDRASMTGGDQCTPISVASTQIQPEKPEVLSVDDDCDDVKRQDDFDEIRRQEEKNDLRPSSSRATHGRATVGVMQQIREDGHDFGDKPISTHALISEVALDAAYISVLAARAPLPSDTESTTADEANNFVNRSNDFTSPTADDSGAISAPEVTVSSAVTRPTGAASATLGQTQTDAFAATVQEDSFGRRKTSKKKNSKEISVVSNEPQTDSRDLPLSSINAWTSLLNQRVCVKSRSSIRRSSHSVQRFTADSGIFVNATPDGLVILRRDDGSLLFLPRMRQRIFSVVPTGPLTVLRTSVVVTPPPALLLPPTDPVVTLRGDLAVPSAFAMSPVAEASAVTMTFQRFDALVVCEAPDATTTLRTNFASSAVAVLGGRSLAEAAIRATAAADLPMVIYEAPSATVAPQEDRAVPRPFFGSAQIMADVVTATETALVVYEAPSEVTTPRRLSEDEEVHPRVGDPKAATAGVTIPASTALVVHAAPTQVVAPWEPWDDAAPAEEIAPWEPWDDAATAEEIAPWEPWEDEVIPHQGFDSLPITDATSPEMTALTAYEPAQKIFALPAGFALPAVMAAPPVMSEAPVRPSADGAAPSTRDGVAATALANALVVYEAPGRRSCSSNA